MNYFNIRKRADDNEVVPESGVEDIEHQLRAASVELKN